MLMFATNMEQAAGVCVYTLLSMCGIWLAKNQKKNQKKKSK